MCACALVCVCVCQHSYSTCGSVCLSVDRFAVSVCRIGFFMLPHTACSQTTVFISVVNTQCYEVLRSIAMATGFLVSIKTIYVIALPLPRNSPRSVVSGGTFLCGFFHLVDLFFFNTMINMFNVKIEFCFFLLEFLCFL